MKEFQPGLPAPDVRLSDGTTTHWLADVLGKKTVVLYFYPKDDTPGCTLEACGFRDAYEQFVDAGAEVIGVSRDSAESHARFKAKHKLPFTLLSDPDGKAAEAFGVSKTFGLIAGRSTFVIDRQGRVQLRFDGQLRINQHVNRALALVKQLTATPE